VSEVALPGDELVLAMKLSFQDRLKHVPAATEKLVTELFWEMAPKVLFFFGAFGMLFLLFKLFVAQYSIEYSAFAKAAVAALILGKIIAILDWAESGHRFENHRRILVIAAKTLLYALVVIVLGTGERMLEEFRKQGGVGAALNFVIANANMQRFLGLVLLISLTVGIYLTIQEIDRALGEGTMSRLLLERPANTASAPYPPR
jgi:hypothetical protein